MVLLLNAIAGGLLLTLNLITQHVAADKQRNGHGTKQVPGGSTFYLGQERDLWQPLVQIAVHLNQINSIKSTFQLRTYDPEGAIFYGDTENGKEWFILALKGGNPLMLLYRKDVLVHVSGGPNLNDGQWHTLEVSNQGNYVILEVDGVKELVMGLHSQQPDDVIYTKLRLGLGGILIDSDRVNIPFDSHLDACIRGGSFLNLTIPWELDAETLWPCYPNIQPGIFFPGTGLAILNTTDLPVEEESGMRIDLVGDFSRLDGTILSIRSLAKELLFTLAANNETEEISLNLKGVGISLKNNIKNLTITLQKDSMTVFEDENDLTPSKSIPISQVDPLIEWRDAQIAIGGLIGNGGDNVGTQFLTGCLEKILIQGKSLDLDLAVKHKSISSHSCPI
ncbi:sex hormone-binding globulin [Synchiropus splendidus]|uniref:sex hormone-binding globulin n=1 Tax=Synchiropus splendidus TaxID=270530 RepID=UPI00237E7E5C|nr:sex hormone-binding globulin [Synchiropus splendidus]